DPRPAWERRLATPRVAGRQVQWTDLMFRDAERPGLAFPRGAWERGLEGYELYEATISMTPTALAPETPATPSPAPDEAKLARRLSRRQGLFAPDLLKTALKQAFVMLRPDIQWKNPVMFVVEVGTVLTIVFTVLAIAQGRPWSYWSYFLALDVWLLLT